MRVRSAAAAGAGTAATRMRLGSAVELVRPVQSGVGHGLPRLVVDASAAPSLARPKAPINDRNRVGLLSLVAGFVDAAGFVMLLGLFPAHLTGELVGAAVAVASGQPSLHGARYAMIPIFVLSVVVAVVVSRAFRQRGKASRAPLLALMTVALALFSLSGFVLPSSSDAPSRFALIVREGSAVAAMGFQNTFMREALSGSCPTTVMTGNLTQFVIELVDLSIGRLTREGQLDPVERAKAESRLKLVGTALGAFSFGAVLGGWLTGIIGPLSVAIPTVLVAALTRSAWRESQP